MSDAYYVFPDGPTIGDAVRAMVKPCVPVTNCRPGRVVDEEAVQRDMDWLMTAWRGATCRPSVPCPPVETVWPTTSA